MRNPDTRPGPDPLLEETLALLSDCAAATREARFDRLPPLVAEVEARIAAFGTAGPEHAPMLRHIRRGLENNHRLLAAAATGVQAARRRIGEVGDAMRTLNTYDSQGRRASIRDASDGFERKA